MPYVGREANSFTTVVDVTVSDDLTVTDDATIGGDLNVSGATTITTADNTTQLSLISTDADAAVGPVLDLYRNSASPADNDVTGRIIFSAENDADEKTEYTRIITYMPDVSNGSEDAAIQYYLLKDGTSIQRLEHSPTETVFNQDSADVDFRVESNGNANMLFVDGGNDNVTMQSTSAGASTTPFILHNASSNANTDVRMLLAPCTTAADRPVILSAKNNGSNVVDFGISTPNGGTPVQRVTIAGSDGTIDVETGDIFFSTAGKGIVLGATSNTDANTLHDYEEGSFTPTWAAASGTIGPYLSSNQGKYTKIGQMVYVYGYISYGSNSSASGDVFIEGLPFTAIAGIGQSSAYNAGIKVFRSYSWGSNAPIEGYMVNSTARFGLLSYSGTGSIPTQFSHFNTNANTSQAPFFGIYHTAS